MSSLRNSIICWGTRSNKKMIIYTVCTMQTTDTHVIEITTTKGITTGETTITQEIPEEVVYMIAITNYPIADMAWREAAHSTEVQRHDSNPRR